MIAASDGFKAHGLKVFIALVLGTAAFRQALKNPQILRRWHGFLLHVPLIGRLIRDLNTARFSRTIAGLIHSGTPALAAMDTALYTLKNLIMRDAAKQAAEQIRQGSSMSRALKKTDVFPPLIIQMIAGGETSGDVGQMFSKSADYLEDEFESATTIFMSLLEPMIIILLSLVVLLIIAAIFLPILQLNTLVL